MSRATHPVYLPSQPVEHELALHVSYRLRRCQANTWVASTWPGQFGLVVDDDGDWLTRLVTGHASRGITAVDFAGMVVWAAEQMRTEISLLENTESKNKIIILFFFQFFYFEVSQL